MFQELNFFFCRGGGEKAFWHSLDTSVCEESEYIVLKAKIMIWISQFVSESFFNLLFSYTNLAVFYYIYFY